MKTRGVMVLGSLAALAVLLFVLEPDLLRTSGPPAEPEGEQPAPREEKQETPAPPTPERVEESTSWRILGRVLGPDPDSTEPTTIRVTAIGLAGWSPGGEVLGEAASDGRFELDVSALFAGKAKVAELEVRADHPGFLPASARVSAVKGGRDYRVEVKLVRAAIVTGRVVDEKGDPVEKAGVSTYEFHEGKPGRDTVERTLTGRDGTYRLRAVGNEVHLIVTGAEGLRPDQTIVSPLVGKETVAPDLVLRAGMEISGVVRDSGRPAAGATVEAYIGNRAHTLYAAERQLTWSVGRLENARITVRTSDEGRYVLRGLVSETYKIRAAPGPGDPGWVDLRSRATRKVAAPAAGVDFDLAGARLVIELRADGKPLAEKHYMVVAHGTYCSVQTGGEGRTSLVCDPGAELVVTIRHEGYEEYEARTLAPETGNERTEIIELEPLRPRPTLILTLRRPGGGDAIHKAGFGLFRLEGTDFQMSFPKVIRDLASDGGRFRLKGLDPGPLRLVVRPGGSYYGGRGYFLEGEITVDLPADGEVEREILIHAGGRLRLSARDDAGGFLPATVKIRDSANSELPIDLVFRQQGVASFGGDELDKGVCEVLRALPAGWYEVEFALDGYLTETLPVKISEGETAEIKAVLEARR